MQHPRLADPDHGNSHSPLGDSLIQIAERAAQIAPAASDTEQEKEATTAAKFDWQERFAENRERITRRLQMIESELERMNDPSPSLSVFAGESSSD
jgi:hypothetical protein